MKTNLTKEDKILMGIQSLYKIIFNQCERIDHLSSSLGKLEEVMSQLIKQYQSVSNFEKEFLGKESKKKGTDKDKFKGFPGFTC